MSDSTSKYLGGKYFLGDASKGFDCLSLFLDYYRSLGYDFPKEWEGVNESNYADLWTHDNQKAIALFEKFFLSLGEPIDPAYFIRDDLLLFKAAELRLFPAIALGNGNMLIANIEGPIVVPFRPYRKYLFAVRRLIK